MEILDSIDVTTLGRALTELSHQKQSIEAGITRLKKLIRFLDVKSTMTPATEDTPAKPARVPRGLFERLCGLFERCAGDTFIARELATQLDVTAADVLLCVERKPRAFYRIGDKLGMRQRGK